MQLGHHGRVGYHGSVAAVRRSIERAGRDLVAKAEGVTGDNLHHRFRTGGIYVRPKALHKSAPPQWPQPWQSPGGIGFGNTHVGDQ